MPAAGSPRRLATGMVRPVPAARKTFLCHVDTGYRRQPPSTSCYLGPHFPLIQNLRLILKIDTLQQ